MTQKNMSPEERLLSLLRRKKKPSDIAVEADRRTQPVQAERPDEYSHPKRTLPAFKFSKEMFMSPSFLRTVNIYLAIAAVICAGFLVWEFTREGYSAKDAIGQSTPAKDDTGAGKLMPAEAVGALREYAVYSGEIAGKKIFGQLADADKNIVQAAIAPEDVQNKLGLVGVVTGDSPQAIIEDRKSQKVYYLTKGQSFDVYTVIDISEGRVTLEVDGKQIALVL